MALAWLLKDNRVTSVLIGASRAEQLADSLKALDNITFSADELSQIEKILAP
jgi:L-glyceraldehyde 3-phosphate reductase